MGVSELSLEGAGLYDDLGVVGVDDDEPLDEVPGAGLEAVLLDLGGAGLYDDLGEVGVDDDAPLVKVPDVGLDAAQLDLGGGVSCSSSEIRS